MISLIRGTVLATSLDGLVVDLGSVGLSVSCTAATSLGTSVGDHVELFTSLVVREDGWTLFGFVDPDERTVFETVQTVSGIGPRIALALLGTMSPDELRTAVAREDLATLVKVPGIGRKGAGRLVLELKDRLGAPVGGEPAAVAATSGAEWAVSVAAGLTSLGWTAKDAESAVLAVTPMAESLVDAQGRPDISALLKAALRSLDRS